jgi:arabinofuranosyltransferase
MPTGLRAAYELGARLIPLLAVAVHVMFYTILIGGDHFEYRVLSHLIPLLFVALIWGVNSVEWRPVTAIGTVLACICLSWPVPWVHWAMSQRREAGPRDPSDDQKMIVEPVHIEHAFPKALRGYTRDFDRMQDWMLLHFVCVRYHGHRYFWRQQVSDCPSREEGLRMAAEDYPVVATHTVGILGWVLPKANIIDLHGLNDYVVARTSHPSYMTRRLAHERYPPSGYVESFAPNVTLVGKKIVVTPRIKTLTAAGIETIERRWAHQVH